MGCCCAKARKAEAEPLLKNEEERAHDESPVISPVDPRMVRLRSMLQSLRRKRFWDQAASPVSEGSPFSEASVVSLSPDATDCVSSAGLFSSCISPGRSSGGGSNIDKSKRHKATKASTGLKRLDHSPNVVPETLDLRSDESSLHAFLSGLDESCSDEVDPKKTAGQTA